ncbi:MAG: cyclodeaminase/cyclohydrolase family protein [Clostridia bacterium]|nr:cyclodeaminase/cyclohydrolase family protein [Clostridia bacterium]
MKLIEMTVTDYLDILASDAPAPGGGSAAALCGAQGAGLVAMVAGQTTSKVRYEAEWPIAQHVIDECTPVYEALTRQVDKDTDAYNLVAAAFKMPKSTDEEKTVRRQAIAEATLVATEAPFETLKLAVDALELALTLPGHYNTNCASDLGVGVHNLHTAAHGAWMNVKINLGGVKDEEKAAFFAEEGGRLIARANEITMTVLDCVWKDIQG